MSTHGKTTLFVSGFCLIILMGTRFVLGAWHPFLYVFLSLFILNLIASIFFDYKLYLEFLSVKTARKGLSLGWSLLLVLILLISVSYLGNRFNKSFDFTEEGINSLSEQSLSILKTLDSHLMIYVFYKGDKISEQVINSKQELKNNVALYKQQSSKVKLRFMDTYKNNVKAEKYLGDLPDKNQREIFVFIDYKNRKVRVEAPFTEETLTSAIIKVQKREFKEILFLTGHGEKELNVSEPGGLKIFKQSLEDSGFLLKEWNFIEEGGEPKTKPYLIMIVGSRRPYLDSEKTWLKNYLSKGGHLFVSLDPNEKHNLTDFLKMYGVVFNNDFILSQMGMFYGGPTKALGTIFSKDNPITKRFLRNQTVFFEQASSLNLDIEIFDDLKFSSIVKSHSKSFTVPELTENVKVGSLRSLTMAVEVKKISKEKEQVEASKEKEQVEASKEKEQVEASKEKGQQTDKPSNKGEKGFRLVVFGDSDFLTNRYIHEGANRDLALNTVVSLIGEEELVSIRPKQPKGTKITLNQRQRTSLILVYIILPFLFLLGGLWMWYRRREA